MIIIKNVHPFKSHKVGFFQGESASSCPVCVLDPTVFILDVSFQVLRDSGLSSCLFLLCVYVVCGGGDGGGDEKEEEEEEVLSFC